MILSPLGRQSFGLTQRLPERVEKNTECVKILFGEHGWLVQGLVY
mgnify:FL=1